MPAKGSPQTQPDSRIAAAEGERPRLPDHVTMIAVASAATAVVFLVLLTQTAALLLNPHGRDTLDQVFAQAGIAAADRPEAFVVYAITVVLIELLPAILHGAAFYGLVGARRAGWVLAFLLSLAWSVVLVGIPFAYLLWRRDTRDAFGIS
jgi:hypothetical protein